MRNVRFMKKKWLISYKLRKRVALPYQGILYREKKKNNKPMNLHCICSLLQKVHGVMDT